MSRRLAALALLLAALQVPGPDVRAEESPGIRWESDLEAGLARAAREGRPVLFAVNALETEAANNRLAQVLYPSAAWGEAASPYVCFVANPGDHASVTGTSCARYGGSLPCRAHQDCLRYVLRRFAPVARELISPQHVVLEPDGGVAFRKEYYTGVVGPDLLADLALVIAPSRALARASTERADRVDAFEALPLADVADSARAWLRSGDRLAAAGILCAIEFTFEDDRRLALVEAFDATPPNQLPVLGWYADAIGTAPEDAPEEARALANALDVVDREAALRLRARLLVRNVATWGDEAPANEEEAAARQEAFLLAGLDTPGTVSAPTPRWRDRLARAAGARRYPPLDDALADGNPGALAGALLEAPRAEVEEHADAVRTLLTAGSVRLGHAAAIALLGAGLDAGGAVPAWVWSAVQDPLEGPDLHPEAVRRLGRDPGSSREAWMEAIAEKLGGGR